MHEPCGSTLIVVPPAILQQWHDEIERHAAPEALSLLVYHGQMQAGGGGHKAEVWEGGKGA